uniref:Uncharacterized protein n=1 Tax=Gadus morhua TaxID=8049 RepID=A0A8C5CM88_GADMO
MFGQHVERCWPTFVCLVGRCATNGGAVTWLVQRERTVPDPLCCASLERLCRLIVFKILAQSVILGCTWVLGLYQANLFFQVLFILLNSQQGTFLFIVHCLLNKEVGPNQEHLLWFIFIQDSKNRTITSNGCPAHSGSQETLEQR